MTLAPILAAALAVTASAADSPLEAIRKDREDTMKWLKSDPSSYLAAVKRVSFGDKIRLTVGSAADNDIALAGLKAHHLSLAVAGAAFHAEAADPGADFTLGKSTKAVRSADTGPAKIGLGARYNLRLSHQGYPAVIVFDAKSPRFKEFKGIDYFKPDLTYRFKVALIADQKAETLAIQSSGSGDRKALRVGWFDLAIGSVPVRLAAHRLLEPGAGPDDLSVFFRDLTTGKQSYAVGRYVEPVKQADGSYILDFNMAYNPACAFSPFYNCPIPPKENHLRVAILAGEKNSHYSH